MDNLERAGLVYDPDLKKENKRSKVISLSNNFRCALECTRLRPSKQRKAPNQKWNMSSKYFNYYKVGSLKIYTSQCKKTDYALKV